MAHTYASVAEFKQSLVESADDYGNASDADILSTLEAVSRSIDEWCRRSDFGSGFGPRLGTNRYDGNGECWLDLKDDLIATTSTITTLDSTGGTSSNLTAETDYYLVDGFGHYDNPPYRKVLLHGQGSMSRFGVGFRVTSVPGKFGYQDVRRTLAPTVGEALDDSETEIDVSGLSDLSAGLTLLLDSEQVYVRATTDAVTDSITVDRAANGTTAATHLTGIAIARYVYPPAVKRACILATQRRRRMGEAGLTGEMGSGSVPTTAQRDTERSIFREQLWQLRAG